MAAARSALWPLSKPPEVQGMLDAAAEPLGEAVPEFQAQVAAALAEARLGAGSWRASPAAARGGLTPAGRSVVILC